MSVAHQSSDHKHGVHLDWNGTSPIDESALEQLQVMREFCCNPDSTHHRKTLNHQQERVRDCLASGLSGRDQGTITKCTILADTHVIPGLGARKLRELTADDVDKWLAEMAQTLSTRSMREV